MQLGEHVKFMAIIQLPIDLQYALTVDPVNSEYHGSKHIESGIQTLEVTHFVLRRKMQQQKEGQKKRDPLARGEKGGYVRNSKLCEQEKKRKDKDRKRCKIRPFNAYDDHHEYQVPCDHRRIWQAWAQAVRCG